MTQTEFLLLLLSATLILLAGLLLHWAFIDDSEYPHDKDW